MKPAYVLAIAILTVAAPALAQAPGPHDPNPPRESPDLRLPPPCAPTPNLAADGVAAKPEPAAGAIEPAATCLPW